MRKVDSKIKALVIIISSLCCISMLTFLILMASYNQPIADQYNFMANLRDNGILGYTAEMYTTWSGRLIQTIGLGIVYRIFGDIGAQIAAPIILLFLLGTVFTWLIYQAIKFKNHQATYSALLGFLLASGTLYTTTCLFDVYLWLDAAFVHMLGLIAIVYDVALYIWACKNYTKIKATVMHKIILAILLIIAAFLQTASEASMAMTLGWSFLALVSTFFYKKWHKYRAPAAIIFTTLLAGSLIMILAPGLWSRAGYTSDAAPLSFMDLTINRPLVGIRRLVESLSLWKICLMLIIGFTIGIFNVVKITKKHIKFGAIASILILISSVYIPIVLYFYGSHATGIETRALAVPNMGIMISVVIFTMIITSYLTQKYNTSKSFLIMGSATVIAIFSIFTVNFFKFNKGYISTLVTRNNLVVSRNKLIYQYQNGEISSLKIPDAPVMIENSGATDFSHNGWANIQWFFDSFIEYFHINPEDITVYGEKLVDSQSKKDWYYESSRTTCTTGSYLILDKYYCEYSIEEEK